MLYGIIVTLTKDFHWCGHGGNNDTKIFFRSNL